MAPDWAEEVGKFVISPFAIRKKAVRHESERISYANHSHRRSGTASFGSRSNRFGGEGPHVLEKGRAMATPVPFKKVRRSIFRIFIGEVQELIGKRDAYYFS